MSRGHILSKETNQINEKLIIISCSPIDNLNSNDYLQQRKRNLNIVFMISRKNIQYVL